LKYYILPLLRNVKDKFKKKKQIRAAESEQVTWKVRFELGFNMENENAGIDNDV
jgi:hypothetical protein